MKTELIPTLKIHKLTQQQYDREKEAGNLDESALYLTPDDEIDLDDYVLQEDLDAKQDLLTFDAAPISESNNPVTSNGIKTALDKKQDQYTKIEILETICENVIIKQESPWSHTFSEEIAIEDGALYSLIYHQLNENQEEAAILYGIAKAADNKINWFDGAQYPVRMTSTEIKDYFTIKTTGEETNRAYASFNIYKIKINDTEFDKTNQDALYYYFIKELCYSSIASGRYSTAEGQLTYATGLMAHAEGDRTIAASRAQHAQGQFNIEDNAGTYAHIVGNDTSDTTRANAHTLDWNGNAWFAGNIYVNSTSGTNKDEGSIKVATMNDIGSFETGAGELSNTNSLYSLTISFTKTPKWIILTNGCDNYNIPYGISSFKNYITMSSSSSLTSTQSVIFSLEWADNLVTLTCSLSSSNTSIYNTSFNWIAFL